MRTPDPARNRPAARPVRRKWTDSPPHHARNPRLCFCSASSLVQSLLFIPLHPAHCETAGVQAPGAWQKTISALHLGSSERCEREKPARRHAADSTHIYFAARTSPLAHTVPAIRRPKNRSSAMPPSLLWAPVAACPRVPRCTPHDQSTAECKENDPENGVEGEIAKLCPGTDWAFEDPKEKKRGSHNKRRGTDLRSRSICGNSMTWPDGVFRVTPRWPPHRACCALCCVGVPKGGSRSHHSFRALRLCGQRG